MRFSLSRDIWYVRAAAKIAIKLVFAFLLSIHVDVAAKTIATAARRIPSAARLAKLLAYGFCDSFNDFEIVCFSEHEKH